MYLLPSRVIRLMAALQGLSLGSVVVTVTSIRIWANQAEKIWRGMLELRV
jgi:hypothetical protein